MKGFCKSLACALGLFVCPGLIWSAPAVEYFPAETFLRPVLASPTMIAHELPLSQFTRLEPTRAATAEPFWELAQWHCESGLKQSDRAFATPSETVWSNGLVAAHFQSDEQGHSLVRLTTDSLAIYSRTPIPYARMSNIRPHFLLSHNFYPDQDGVRVMSDSQQGRPDGSVISNLNSYASLVMSLKARLERADDLRASYTNEPPQKHDYLYNRNCFQFWFRIYCRDRAAASYGQSFWVGFRIYDSVRPYKFPTPYRVAHIESDGRMFAYLAAPLDLFGADYAKIMDALQHGEETPLKFDVLGFARKALVELQRQKKTFLDAPADLAGFTISDFTIGWELASPFRGVMALRDLSLRGEWAVAEKAENDSLRATRKNVQKSFK